MASGLFNTAIQLFTVKTLEHMTVKTGEPEGRVRHALEHITPLLLRRFATRAAERQDAADHFLKIVRPLSKSGLRQQIGIIFGQGNTVHKEKQVLAGLFNGPDEILSLTDEIARKAQIKQSSAMILLHAAGPLCLSAIDKYATEQEINPGRLASWVANQKLGFEETPSTAILSGIPLENQASEHP